MVFTPSYRVKCTNNCLNVQMVISKNIQLEGAYKIYDLTAIRVIKNGSIDLQLRIMVSGSWY